MLIWEIVGSEMAKKGVFADPAPGVMRAKVPGGWFVRTYLGMQAGSAFFYPDPEHLWDGSSLP